MPPRHRDFIKIENIRDGALGISYQRLFGQYLEEAQWVRLVDPYLRTARQIYNLEEFINLVSTYERCAWLEVVTMYDDNRQLWSRQQLDSIRQRFFEKGVRVTYHFDPVQHDRFLETDKHYVILGRGLDLFYPDSSFASVHERQRARACKIIYIPKNSPALIETG